MTPSLVVSSCTSPGFPDYAGCGEFQFTKGKLTVKQLAAADLPVVIYEFEVAFTVW